MAYDAIDWTKPLQYDANGQPYATTASGKKSYLPPALALQMHDDPRAIQWAASQGYTRETPFGPTSNGNTFAHQNNGWNSNTGTFDRGMNWGGLGGLILGGAAVAGPAVIGPALAGSAAAGGAGAAGASAGTGTGATAAGSVATGAAGHGVAGAALRYGAPIAGQLINARMQGNAERDAAKIQADYNDRALAAAQEDQTYRRGQFADYQARLQPYQQAGTAALARQSAAMTSRPQPAITGAAMVTLKAPNGQMSQVPANQAAHYEAKGAVRV